MKKQSNLSHPHARKLGLNKKTITNLTSNEMKQNVGGGATKGNHYTCRWTCGRTCIPYC